MKPSYLALVLANAIGGSAFAQSNVTIFGTVDVGVRWVESGDFDQTSVSSSGITFSRLGFRGTEDLGNGLTAGFWLEHSIAPDTGEQANDRFWHRRATVSLSGGFGEVRLGREFVPTYNDLSNYNITVGLEDFAKFDIGLGSDVDTNTRADNLVAYYTPDMGGFFGHVAAAAGGGQTGKSYRGARVGYAAGPISVSGSYGVTRSADETTAEPGDFKKATVAASYNFGIAQVLATYVTEEFLARKNNFYGIGLRVPVGAHQLRASFTSVDGDLDADARQFAVGYIHNLSKRTALYGNYVQIDNEPGAAFDVEDAGNTLPGATSKGVDFGIRHNF